MLLPEPFSRAALCLALRVGCTEPSVDADASSPDASSPDAGLADTSTPDAGVAACTLDGAARTLRCVRFDDPDPAAVDDEARAGLVLTLAEGAFDGSARAIAGEVDYVVTELSREWLTIDELSPPRRTLHAIPSSEPRAAPLRREGRVHTASAAARLGRSRTEWTSG